MNVITDTIDIQTFGLAEVWDKSLRRSRAIFGERHRFSGKKLCFLPIDIKFFGPKTAKFGQKLAFLVIFTEIQYYLGLDFQVHQGENEV